VLATATSVSYGTQFIGKLMSGFLIDYFRSPKLFLLIASGICIIITFVNGFYMTDLAILIGYPIIKLSAAFGRIAILSIFATWYPKEVIGTVSSVLQMT
jgi:sugar phosphate permease